MSTLQFQIGDWARTDDHDLRRAYTSADLIIVVDGIPITKLFDAWSRTVTDRARLPLYSLAEWFAANWWRLHAEAPYDGGAPPLDWRLSHDLPSIGGGFVWPRMRFASDDRTIQVSARALPNAAWEPVRHLNELHPARSVTVGDFDKAVEGLVSAVLDRLKDVGIPAEPLATIWSDVLAERSEVKVAEWRRWEARLGYDPGQASDGLMQRVAALFDRVGRDATAEIAPLLASTESRTLEQLEILAKAPGIEADFDLRGTAFRVPPDAAPWEAGRTMAHVVRNALGCRTGPIDDGLLNASLGLTGADIANAPRTDSPIGLGVRSPDRGRATLHFRRRNPAGLRFEAARFLADSFLASDADLWLPLTDRATARQKTQRAFAAEFLAPIEEIREAVGEDRMPDRFEEVADRYGVSPLAIRSQLANHGLLTSDDVVV